jgi:hypothetical protein
MISPTSQSQRTTLSSQPTSNTISLPPIPQSSSLISHPSSSLPPFVSLSSSSLLLSSEQKLQQQPQQQPQQSISSQSKSKRKTFRFQNMLQILKSLSPEISVQLRDAPLEITSDIVSAFDEKKNAILKFSEMFVPAREQELSIEHLRHLRTGSLSISHSPILIL